MAKAIGRKPNSAFRTREYLLLEEVESLMKAAGLIGRHRLRDSAFILISFRHGLRVSEAINLQWEQIGFRGGHLHINRLKNGNPSVHYLEEDEMQLLRRLRKISALPFVFVTELGGPPTRSTINKMVSKAGERAGIIFPVHPHMLRHACGYFLANRGTDTRVIQDYLGHKSIQHTVRYTQLASARFRGLWS